MNIADQLKGTGPYTLPCEYAAEAHFAAVLQGDGSMGPPKLRGLVIEWHQRGERVVEQSTQILNLQRRLRELENEMGVLRAANRRMAKADGNGND